jgi:hypothetical protein
MDAILRNLGWRYFFFGPLLAIGGLGAALLVLLPPLFDISVSSCELSCSCRLWFFGLCRSTPVAVAHLQAQSHTLLWSREVIGQQPSQLRTRPLGDVHHQQLSPPKFCDPTEPSAARAAAAR